MSKLDELKAEELELDRMMFGGGEEKPGEKPGEAPAPSPEFEDEPLESAEATAQAPSRPETPKKTRTSWKQRYTNYKASTDATLYQLRQDLAVIKAELADVYEERDKEKNNTLALQAELRKNKDPYEGVITDEDREIIGEEAVDVIKRVMDSKKEDPRLSELQKEVEEYKKDKLRKLRLDQENMRTQSQESLRDGLTKLVSNFESVDNDPKFNIYLSQVDEVSGIPRKDLFAAAVNARDIKGAARFYEDFNSLRPKTREEILAGKVSPSGGGATNSDSQQGGPKLHKFSDWSKFMDRVTKGHFKSSPKEKSRLTAMYDKAMAEGRMILDA